jgi:hypothetical protein
MSLLVTENLSLKVWVRDRILFLALVIFFVGGAFYIGAGKFLDPHNEWLHPIKEFSLLLSLIGVVSLGYELFLREMTFREYKGALEEIVNPDAVRLGIEGIYKNRSELGRSISFESLFREVEKELFVGGSSLLSIATSSAELLKKKVLSGVNVRLLLMDPNSYVVEIITRQGKGRATFLNEIRTSLMLLQKISHEIDSELGYLDRGKLIVHTYDCIPSHSFICLDEGSLNAKIVADIGPYLGRTTPRPSMVVVNKKDGIYDYWQKMGDLLWQESKFFNMSKDDLFGTQAKAFMFTSGASTRLEEKTEFYCKNTDSWEKASICKMNKNWRSIKGSQWIWVAESATPEEIKTGTKKRFRLLFNLPSDCQGECVVRADLFLRSSDECRLNINDVAMNQAYGGASYPEPFIVDISRYLKSGGNEIGFELISFARPDVDKTQDSLAGLIYRLHLEYKV